MEFSKLEDEMIETPTQKTQRTWLDIKALRKRFYTEKAILAVDEYALILFPLSFGLFNVLYWLTIANDSESTFTNSWQNTGKCTWHQIAFLKKGPATQATTHVVVRLCPSARAEMRKRLFMLTLTLHTQGNMKLWLRLASDGSPKNVKLIERIH